jgi:hypothetical protein
LLYMSQVSDQLKLKHLTLCSKNISKILFQFFQFFWFFFLYLLIMASLSIEWFFSAHLLKNFCLSVLFELSIIFPKKYNLNSFQIYHRNNWQWDCMKNCTAKPFWNLVLRVFLVPFNYRRPFSVIFSIYKR